MLHKVARSTALHEAKRCIRGNKLRTSSDVVNNWTRRNAGDMHGHWAFAGRPPVICREKFQPARSPMDDTKGAVPVTAS